MARVTSASGVPSAKVMPADTATAVVAPAPVVPPVTLGVPSGWQRVLTDAPPLVPCPALTQMVFPLGCAAWERYSTAFPELILENSAYGQEASSQISSAWLPSEAADEPEDSPARRLAAFMVSAAGQEVVSSAGFLPLPA